MKKFIFTIIALLGILMPNTAWAQEPYAVLSEDNTTLTFYYDEQKEARGGLSVGPFTYDSNRWNNKADYLTTVVFDSSFANCTTITSTAYWFVSCPIDTIIGIENLKTPNVTDMNSMFSDCQYLKSLDLSGFKTDNVTDMSAMFNCCVRLKNLDISNFNTSKVTNMGAMFYGCSSLTSLDISSFNTENVTNMSIMFSGCNALTSLNVNNFKTDKVTSMRGMFSYCIGLSTLDLSSFETNSLEEFPEMFEKCYRLKTIYVGNAWNVSKLEWSPYVFSDCTTLVGGAGTTYDPDHTDYTYAHIDEGPSNPGYFTDINAQTSYDVRVDVVGYGKVKIGEMEIDNSGMVTLSVDRGGSLTLTFVPDEGYKLGSVTVGSTTGSNDVTSQVETSGTGAQTYTLNNVYDTYLIMVTYVNDEPKEQVAAPTFGFEGYDLTMATETEDATIRYMMEEWTYENIDSAYVQADKMTVDISGAIYDGPLGTVTHNVIVKAYASKDDMIDSEISTLVYYGRAWLKLQETIDYGERLFSEANGNEKVNQELLENLHWALEEGAMMYGRRAEAPSQEATMWTEHITELCKQVEEQMNAGSKEPEAYAVLSEENKTLTFYYDNQKSNRGGIDINNKYIYWDSTSPYGTATTAIFDASFADYKPTSTAYWFQECSSLTTINGIENLKTDNVTNMDLMFYGCSSLTNLDVSGFKTNNVTNMQSMFYGCSSLTSLDVSGFNTDNVTTMNTMFSFCSGLTNLDLSGFNTENLTSTYFMFDGCSSLTSLDLSGFKTDKVKTMEHMFDGCSSLETIFVSENWTTAKVEEGGNMFFDCAALVGGNGTKYDANHVDQTYARIDKDGEPGYFTAAGSEPYIEPQEPEPYACQNGEDGSMLTFFYNDARSINGGYLIEEFRADSLVAWREIKDQIRYVAFDSSFAEFRPNSTAHWFEGFSNLENVSSLENLNTSEVYDMEAMFAGCKKLTTLAGIETLNTSNVVNMYRMFTECSSLEYLDVSHFDTSNSVITCNMFSFCSSLESLDMSGFNTSKVGDFSHMFAGCTNLKSIDVSHFDTSNGVHMGSIFAQCSSLTSIDLSSFNTEKAEGMSMLFQDCTGLTNIDVSHFNTSNVTSIDRMFDGCTGLTTLDLSNFDTGKVTAIFQMFKDCSNLKTIYVSDKWTTDSVKEGFQVFANCQSIVGGAGTQFDPEHTDYSYAHIDGGPNNPGYFTDKDAPVFDDDWRILTGMGEIEGKPFAIVRVDNNFAFYCSDNQNLGFDQAKNVIGNTDFVGYKFKASLLEGTTNHFLLRLITLDGSEYSIWGSPGYLNAQSLETGWCCFILGLGDGDQYGQDFENGAVWEISYVEGKGYTLKNVGTGKYLKDAGNANQDEPTYFNFFIEGSSYATYENYVLTVEGDLSMAQALEQVGGRDVVVNDIAAIVWNSTEAITRSDIDDLGNPNMLIYVQTDSLAPEGVNNVIIDGKAKNIVLVDADSINNNFYAPQEFTAENIQYTREFKQTTEKDVSRGWEGICLPFNVETYTHESHGTIAPFRNNASEYHFWLHQMTDQGMQIATTIEANKPYIISMPNNGSYPAAYNQAGKVTFAAKNVRISESIPWAMILADGSIGIAGAYQSISYGFYALNVGSEYEGYAEGSVFVNNYRGIRPFEVYGWHNGRDNEGAGARFISLSSLFGGNGTTGIIDVMNTVEPNGEVWYDMNGRRLQSKPARKGVYIHNGKKVVIK